MPPLFNVLGRLGGLIGLDSESAGSGGSGTPTLRWEDIRRGGGQITGIARPQVEWGGGGVHSAVGVMGRKDGSNPYISVGRGKRRRGDKQ